MCICNIRFDDNQIQQIHITPARTHSLTAARILDTLLKLPVNTIAHVNIDGIGSICAQREDWMFAGRTWDLFSTEDWLDVPGVCFPCDGSMNRENMIRHIRIMVLRINRLARKHARYALRANA